MPTIAQRIEKISQNQKTTCVDKMAALTSILVRHPSSRNQAMKAMAKVIPDLPGTVIAQDYIKYVDAAEQVVELGLKDPQKAALAMRTLAAINKNLNQYGYHTSAICAKLIDDVIVIPNAHDKKGLSVLAAQLISREKVYSIYSKSEKIAEIKTYPDEAKKMIELLEAIVETQKVDEHSFMGGGMMSFDRDSSAYSKTINVIANFAKVERHPELAGIVIETLQQQGTKSAAKAIASLMQNHSHHRFIPLSEGKRGNQDISASSIDMDERGFVALESMGNNSIETLVELSQTKKAKSLKRVAKAFIEIDTPQSLKALTQLLHDNPDYIHLKPTSWNYDELELEQQVLIDLTKKPSAKAAMAIVHFGSATRWGVSEAYSTRANAAMKALIDLYKEGKRWSGLPAGELMGVKMAAEQLSQAIVQEPALKNRFMTGKRNQAAIGREFIGASYKSDDLTKIESKRVDVHRAKEDVKAEVKELKALFKEAKRIGLLGANDNSRETLKAFAAYDKAIGGHKVPKPKPQQRGLGLL